MLPLFTILIYHLGLVFQFFTLPKLKLGGLLLTLCLLQARTTNCEQKFTFFFKVQYDHTFWIGEDLYGECGQSNLIQIFLKEGKPLVKKMELVHFEKWEWIEPVKKAMRTEKPYIFIPNSNKIIEDASTGIKIRPPKLNNRLYNQFIENFAENCARQWNNSMKENGIDTPQTWDIDLDLVYYYPDGLYFNYDIEKVCVFPESSLLLVMTKNKERCAGGDTMDGFLIFKFKNI
jgi:hypothetical protein